VALAGGGARQQRLAAAGRTVEQHAPAGAAAELLEQRGLLERQDDAAMDLLLHLREAADVGERDPRLLRLQERRRIGRRAFLPGLVADDREAHDVAGAGGRRVGEAGPELVAQLTVLERRIGGDRLVVGGKTLAMLLESEMGAGAHQQLFRTPFAA